MCGRQRAFTLIELLVVFAIIATLLTFAAPRYFRSVDRAKEAALMENLVTLRHALDKYYEDTGKYPTTLDDLVAAKYLRRIPLDPVTESNTSWVVVPPQDSSRGGVFDVKSGATGLSPSGRPYGEF